MPPTSRCSGAPGSSTTSALPRCWRRSFPRSSRPSPSCWRTTIPRRGSPSRPFPTGSGRANRPATARPIWKPSATSPPGSSCSRPCQRRLSVPSRAWPCTLPSARHCMMTKGLCSARGGARLHPGRRVVSAGGRDAAALPGPAGSVAVLFACGRSCRRRESSGKRSCAWRNAPHDPRSRSWPTMPSGRRGSTLARCRLPASTWRRHRPLHARPAPLLVFRYGQDPGVYLPTLCRLDPLVAGVSGASPGPQPRGAGLGTRAGASLIVWRIALCLCSLVCISFVGTCQPCTSRQRPPSRSSTEQGFPFWAAVGNDACVGGRWPCRVRARRGWPRSARGSPPSGPPGQQQWRPILLHLAGGRL